MTFSPVQMAGNARLRASCQLAPTQISLSPRRLPYGRIQS